ncbi:MAG: hypothetical protein JSS42_00660 [Proteobacteria bacterium]|uniref:hypothetical protein n=1 Tax=Rudaea sp. TaxID=2136325 RepID=UPI00321FAF3B|nr:hypothetical protein [Pseudomonadota bacterium]
MTSQMPARARRAKSAFVSLAFPALLLGAGSALADKPVQPVLVTNDATAPVPVAVQGATQVSGTVTVANTPSVTIANSPSVSVTGPVRVQASVTPYKSVASVADSTSCAPQCYFHFSPVPAGYRLVVTYVSAQIAKAVDSILLDETLFIAQPYPNSGLISAPVTYYFEPGQTPSARLFDPDTSSSATLIVVLIGHLVPAS